MELMNMSDADWDGSCAQLGLEVAHGLFGKKDVNGVGLWDSFKELFKKDEEQENQQKPLTKQSRSEEGTEVVYENVNSEVVMIATSNGTLMGKTVSEAEKSSSSELI
jgi:hypothetical protein